MSMKKSNDTIGNRTRDLPACSAVPQSTAPPRARINPLNAELNPICHMLALLGAHHILHVSRIRVKQHNLRRQTPNLQRKKVSTNFTKTRSHLKIENAKWETRSKFSSLLRAYNRCHRTIFGRPGEIAPGICALLY